MTSADSPATVDNSDDSIIEPPVDELPGEIVGSGATEEVIRRYVRSPEDVLRLVVFATVTLTLLALATWVEDSIVGLERDLIELFGFVTPAIERVLHGTVEVIVVVATLLVWLVPLVTKRYRLFGYIISASLVASVLMSAAHWFVDREVGSLAVNELAARAGITTDVGSGIVGLAQLAAIFITVGPFVSRSWRRAGAVTMAVVVLLRLLVSSELPSDIVLALPLGATCGAAVLLAFGRPDRTPTLGAIAAALGDAGLPVDGVHPASVDARGSTPYFATLGDGTGLFVKVLGAQQRAADLLFRFYRMLRFKDVGDGRPFSSLRRTIEHEALVALLARDVGIRTPRLRGVVDVGADSMLLTYEMLDGTSLDGLPDDAVTDAIMREIWEQVALMRRHRIAHRDLRLANIFIASGATDGEMAWIIDFGFSEVAAAGDLLDADVAQLLASLGVVVGPDRAVTTAVEVLGPDAVGASLPRLQMTALSGATQTALKQHKGLLDELQSEVMSQCHVADVDFVPLERISKGMVVTIAALALATYFLLPQLADLPGIIDQIGEANWGWTPLIILASMVTYAAAAMALAGAVPNRLATGPLLMVSLGSSFASKLAPAGLGGMALNVRFLQKQGVDQTVAVSGVGLDTVAGLAGHASLIGIFIVWAGRDAFGSFSLPDPKWFVIAIIATALLLLIGLAIKPVRRMVIEKLLPILAKAFDGVGAVLRRPGKVAMLLGGSMLLTFAYLTTLYFSIAAFGGGLPFATVGAVFLVGSAVAQAAPTPGGLGALEVALIAGLKAAGLDAEVAVPAVFLYRLFTFWLPVVPGWLAFTWLQRNQYV
ncbi:MAG: flippase-like domain-containing protein [Acidimicrobiia bacterium]|nr:flippase-like domain-containing protein [Acidimicrobiia bacterium]